ncbi:ABC transporter permease [Streptomyces sp. SID14478]|nr:ABC transporter permease [Streptomyces sp. SID14478]
MTPAATPYRLAAGRAPAAPGEVVVTTGGGTRIRPGDRIEVGTPEGPGTRTVVGAVPGAGFESAVFFTAAEAARFAPRIDAVTVDAAPDAVRAALDTGSGSGMTVLTGDDRRRADPDPDRDKEALVSVNALLGTAAGITAFVSVFVVASTFTFAVAQRRREFGLLRMAGATPGQVRRTVYAEALVIGVLASGSGCALGTWGAPRLAAWMAGRGLAPAWFRIDGQHTWPLHVAFWTGLLVALCGVTAASYRAGRTAPTAALREAAVDSATMPWTRRLTAAAALATALTLILVSLLHDPGELLRRKTYVTQPMLLIAAFALLAPLLVRPMTRLLTWLPARLPGAVGWGRGRRGRGRGCGSRGWGDRGRGNWGPGRGRPHAPRERPGHAMSSEPGAPPGRGTSPGRGSIAGRGSLGAEGREVPGVWTGPLTSRPPSSDRSARLSLALLSYKPSPS